MGSYASKLVSGGRLQIPVELRRALGFADGDELLMTIVDGDLRVWSRASAVKRAQAMFRKYAKPGPSLVDELIAERRAEAARE